MTDNISGERRLGATGRDAVRGGCMTKYVDRHAYISP